MDASSIRATFDARQEAVASLRALADEAAGREFTADESEKETRLHAAISEYDERIRSGLAQIERDREMDEARAKFDGLTKPTDEDRGAPSDADLIGRLVRGEVRSVEFGPESRDLTKGTATDGQELVPTSMYGRIHEHMIEVSSVMQANATILRTSGGEDITVPKTTSYSTAAIVGEGAAITESDPQFDKVTLGAFKYGFLTQVSSELLSDSAFDVVAFLARQGGTALGNGIGAHLVSGDGSSKPKGVDEATVGKTLAATNAITADEVIDAYHAVAPATYRAHASWVLNDDTVKAVRKLKDGNNQYLWQPGLVAGAPDLLLGRPVYTDSNLGKLSDGAGTVVGVFGDLSGYFVRLAGPVRVERSDEFAFANDLVTFRFLARADGDIVDTVGIRTIKTAAA